MVRPHGGKQCVLARSTLCGSMSSAATADPFDLQRFVAAQEPVYAQVTAELAAGAKTSHWMWFIFPQLRGLGRSSMAQALRHRLAGRGAGLCAARGARRATAAVLRPADGRAGPQRAADLRPDRRAQAALVPDAVRTRAAARAAVRLSCWTSTGTASATPSRCSCSVEATSSAAAAALRHVNAGCRRALYAGANGCQEAP